MCAGVGYLTVFENDNSIRSAQRAQTVGDGDRRAAADQVFEAS